MMKNSRKAAMDSRFKHQALLQDYQDLLRETEAKRMKLQKTTEKRVKLAAEVRFLRKKYQSFARNPCRLKKLPSTSVGFVQPRDQRAREGEAPSACAMFDLNKNAEEMEETQAELRRCSVDRGVIARELNLSVLKDVGNGGSHVAKRKIAWQDQVALRV